MLELPHEGQVFELPHEEQMFLDCGPSVLNWKVTLHYYPLESIWTQPAYAHWQLPVCMPGEGSPV